MIYKAIKHQTNTEKSKLKDQFQSTQIAEF